MDRQIITIYLNEFRKVIAPFVRSGIGIKTISIPFETGVVVLFELGPNIKTCDETRSAATTFAEAMRRTNLFTIDDDALAPVGTFIEPFGENILLIKDNQQSSWTLERASEDVQQLISKIRNYERKD